MSAPRREHRWYREPMVWLLIALPLTAVIGSFVSLALAIRSDDGLVVDDYYRQGKLINRVLARDQAAARYGLASEVEVDAERRIARVRLTATQAVNLPAQLRLRLMHATRGGLDRDIEASRTPDGSYQGLLPALAPGHWHAQLEANDWRLVGSFVLPGTARLHLAAGRD